jgi:deoxyadenosine/deoxycytidine kinase
MTHVPAHPFIAIEGNIGAGKTSLALKLSEDFKSKIILEEFEENAFLPKFYEEPRRYAFTLEMSFLAARFNQLKSQLLDTDLFVPYIVSDYIFAKCLLFSRITLDDDEFQLYQKLFDIINLQIRQPDLLVYLHNPVEKLKWNIANRGRKYESHIEEDYLKKLTDAYLNYIHSGILSRVLIVDCSSIDFVNNAEHYDNLKQQICKPYQPGVHLLNWLV